MFISDSDKHSEIIKVLHVDDETSQLSFAKLFLEQADPSLQVETITSATEALQKILERDYDCVISDYKMPEIDGIELARRIRDVKEIPFILYTGHGSEEVAEAAFASGVDDYIRKELDQAHYQVLAKRIRQAVEKRRLEYTYRKVVDQSEDGIVIIQDGFIKFVNRKILELTGYTMDDVRGKSFSSFLPEHLKEDAQKRYNTLISDEKTSGNLEYEILLKNGSTILIEASSDIMMYEGRPAILVFFRDITAKKRYRQRLEMLHHYAARLNEADNIKDVADLTLDAIETVIGFTGADFFIVEGRNLKQITSIGDQLKGLVLSLDGKGVTVKAVREKRTVLVQDSRKEPEFLHAWELVPEDKQSEVKKIPDSLSELAVPVSIGNETVALINIESKQLDAFTPDDAKLVEVLAMHVANAMKKLQAEEEIRSYERKLTALHYSALSLSQANDIQNMAEMVLDSLERVMGFKQSGFGVIRGDDLHVIVLKGASTPVPFDMPLNGKGITVRAVRTAETQIVPDVRLDKDFSEPSKDITILSEIAVPVKVDGKAVAVIDLDNERLNAFNVKDQELIEIFAEHVATAIKRIGLLESERSQRAKLDAIHRSAANLAATESIDELCDDILETIRSVLGFNWAGIGLVDQGSIRYKKFIGVELPEEWHLPLDGPGVTVRAVKTGLSQLVPDVRLDPDYVTTLDELDMPPFLSELAVPVLVDERAIAVINLESERLNSFTDEDKKLVEVLAIHAASAFSKLLKIDSLETLVKERTDRLIAAEQLAAAGRVAKMIGHDMRGPLQAIENAIYLLKMSPKDIERACEIINNSVGYAAHILNELQNVTGEEPVNKSKVDLRELVDLALAANVIPKNIDVRIRVEDKLDHVILDSIKVLRVLDNLIRNSIEAMSNGGTLTISAEKTEDKLSIQVVDTGCGIDEGAMHMLFKPFYTTKPKGIGLGLAYCKKAVEDQGGTITVKSRIGEGTTFTISLPAFNELNVEGAEMRASSSMS